MPKSEIPLETLIAQLHDADWEKRCDAARLLGLSGDERAVEALLPDLKDDNWKVRRNAVQALGALKSARAVEGLLQALQDRVNTVRQRAAVALGRIKDPQSIPALIQALLENRSSNVSYAAFQALRKFGKKAAPHVLEALQENPNVYLIDLLESSKASGQAELLVSLACHDNQLIRMRAIGALGKVQDPQAVEFLIELLNGPEDGLKPVVVKALGEMHATRAVPRMLDLLQKDSIYGPHSGIYHAISEAFQEMSGLKFDLENAFPRKFPKLYNMGSAETSLPEAIGNLGDKHINMLNDLLAKMEDRIQEVSELINLPPGVVESFSERTWQFGAMFADARDAREERVKVLLGLLICSSPLKRAAAALTLPWYADGQAIGPLEEALHDEDPTVQRASKWALAALNSTLKFRSDANSADQRDPFGN